ncbi:hypothetical protein [Mucilaginibacter ginkgonis]|uniref:Glycoside hydrolase family 42 N-terminal domain-containing protein n=1 Tax=Mucilaginibacter ginkgonis TaxID=2682091 RepID=A0A6I4HWM2_9SPHI|nr:hypothetical protein [Mucilaginibacter ginkgonis]QQL51235.1 hypothetical protein GO620_007245 [Mucilaginibacter ginkgonis]
MPTSIITTNTAISLLVVPLGMLMKLLTPNLKVLFFAGSLMASCQKNQVALTTASPAIVDSSGVNTPAAATLANTFNNMLGVNGFEWNVLSGDGSQIDENKLKAIKQFTGVRHYLDWSRIESQQGKYTFNPAHSGNWNYDAMYQRLKTENVDVLVCLKTCPDWLLQTYPADQRDAENVPMPYGADKSQPGSYVLQAKAAFQFAARYGGNKAVDASLLKIDNSQRWPGDGVNENKTGLGLIKYIECDNERDKWWKGDKAHQTAQEYAANLSAFYDGNKGSLGKDVGVKNADPNMKVVMAGLAAADPAYVSAMIDWCKQNRGYKADGNVNLCFDIINYHLYTNNNKSNGGTATQGLAPELSEASQIASSFVNLANANHLPVWVTEAGFDVNTQSPQRALAVGNKSEILTQADWLLRTALLYERNSVQKLFFYILYDDNLSSSTQYASSGLVLPNFTNRPAANYIVQAKNLIGGYSFQKTICIDPIVDIYKNGTKTIYVLVVPDQKQRTATFDLLLAGINKVTFHTLSATSTTTIDESKTVTNGKLSVTVTETPVFVEVN